MSHDVHHVGRFEVEQILDRVYVKKEGVEKYHIRWKDYGPEHDTLEPVENVQKDVRPMAVKYESDAGQLAVATSRAGKTKEEWDEVHQL